MMNVHMKFVRPEITLPVFALHESVDGRRSEYALVDEMTAVAIP